MVKRMTTKVARRFRSLISSIAASTGASVNNCFIGDISGSSDVIKIKQVAHRLLKSLYALIKNYIITVCM